MRYSVGQKSAGAFTWWLYSRSDLVAWAGETFDSEWIALRAAGAFKAGAGTARYETYQDAAQQWRWRASRSNDKIAASGESFISEAHAERGAVNVQQNAGHGDGLRPTV